MKFDYIAEFIASDLPEFMYYCINKTDSVMSDEKRGHPETIKISEILYSRLVHATRFSKCINNDLVNGGTFMGLKVIVNPENKNIIEII